MLTVPRQPDKDKWRWRQISPDTQQEALSAADLDGDGDLDLFQGTQWLENPGTTTKSWRAHKIGRVSQSGAEADRNNLADMNGDGRLDAVVGLENGTDLLAFTSGRRPQKPWQRHIIGRTPGGGFSLGTGDFDLDGDIDVVVGEHRNPVANRVLLFENNKRMGFRAHVVDQGDRGLIDHHDGTVPVDLDNDGDLDIISVGWHNAKVWWFENRAL